MGIVVGGMACSGRDAEHGQPAIKTEGSGTDIECGRLRETFEKSERASFEESSRNWDALSESERRAALTVIVDAMLGACREDRWTHAEVSCLLSSSPYHCLDDVKTQHVAHAEAASLKRAFPDREDDALERFGREHPGRDPGSNR
jgi:hypothetical protein